MKTKARLQKPSDKNCKRKALDLPMDVTATTMALIIISKMIYSCLTYGLPAAGGRLPLRMVVPRVHHIFTSPSTILRKRYLGFKGILLPSANCAVKTTLCDGIGHGFADSRFDGGVVRQCAVAVRAYLLCKTMSLHNIDVPSHAQIRPRLDPATSDQGRRRARKYTYKQSLQVLLLCLTSSAPINSSCNTVGMATRSIVSSVGSECHVISTIARASHTSSGKSVASSVKMAFIVAIVSPAGSLARSARANVELSVRQKLRPLPAHARTRIPKQ